MHHFRISAMVAGLAAVTVPAPASLCLAATPAVDSPASTKDQVDDSPPPSKPIPTLSCQCALPKAPIYVEDWDRLADLTQFDPLVSAKASFWRERQNASRWLLGGVILGGGAAALATFDRLGTGVWTDTNKWMLAGGLSTAVLSMLGYWAFAPDRDDRLTVINHWNLRHPDRTLAP
jgi:hypothetical protein